MKNYVLTLLLGLLCITGTAQGLKPYTGRQSDVLFNEKVSYYTIAQARAKSSISTKVIGITNPKKQGIFYLDATDTTTPDDGATCINVGTQRWKRRIDGPFIEAEWWDATGDAQVTSGVQNQTAIQAACNFAAASNNPAAYGAGSPNQNRPNTVHIPAGTYFISGKITLKGAFRLLGDGWQAYGGTLLYTNSAGSGTDLFELAADTDGGSNAVEIERLRLRLWGSATRTRAVYSGNPAGSSFHSLRLRYVGFQMDGANQICYEGLKADDVKFENCAFDGTTAGPAIILGGANADELVSNCSINNCTWYANSGGLVGVIRVDGLQFTNNRVYNNTALPTIFGINALQGTLRADRIQINNNSFQNCRKILVTKFSNAQVIGNTATDCDSRVIEIGGGGIVSGIRVTENTFTGTWSGTVSAGGTPVPDSPIFAYGTGVTKSVFMNTFVQSGTITSGYYMPDTRTTGNILDDVQSGFSAFYGLVASPLQNVRDFNRFVQGDFSISRSKGITAINQDLPSGPYTMNSSTLMPVDASGFNVWLTDINRFENGSGTASWWSGIRTTNLKTKDTYIGGWDQQTSALAAWRKQSTSTPASVQTAVIAAGGVALTAGQIIARDEVLATGSCQIGDLVSFSRTGGQGGMPIELEIRMYVLETDKVRMYIHNTTTTTKTFLQSQYDLKFVRP